MKKAISVLTSLFLVFTFMVAVNAQENDLAVYQNIVNELNQKYEAQAKIFDENEYIVGHYEDVYGISYEEYIQNILATDLQTFKNEWIKVLEPSGTVIAKGSGMARSALGTMVRYFNNNANRMTLNYKHTGSTFDTSYKPTVTVSKVLSSMYFEMQSYTGSFKNSNKTYSVYAKGRVITTYGIVNGKTFTVDFTL